MQSASSQHLKLYKNRIGKAKEGQPPHEDPNSKLSSPVLAAITSSGLFQRPGEVAE